MSLDSNRMAIARNHLNKRLTNAWITGVVISHLIPAFVSNSLHFIVICTGIIRNYSREIKKNKQNTHKPDEFIALTLMYEV